MSKFKVLFYEKEDGTCPIQEFLDSLEPKLKAKSYGLLVVLSEKGNELRGPYSKHIEDGIFELRIIVGSNIVRAFYFFCWNREIVMTNGFVKKTEKTPRREIRLAKKYRDDYLRRFENENS